MKKYHMKYSLPDKFPVLKTKILFLQFFFFCIDLSFSPFFSVLAFFSYHLAEPLILTALLRELIRLNKMQDLL